MKVEKIRRKGFTVLSNDVLNNTALSWKAKGIFAYLWSQSDSWNFYEVEVLKHSTDGKASLKAGLKELESAGYLKRYRVRDGKGFLRESKWILSEEPMSDYPTLDNPTLENRTLENRTLENRTLTNTNYNNTNNNNTNLNEDAVVDTSLVNIEDQQKQTTDCGGFGKIVEFYQENFGMMSSFLCDDMRQTYNEWQQQSKEPDLIIIKAMQIALSNNVRNWKYACAVLRTWEDKRPQSLSDVEALEAEHKNNRTAKSKHAKPENQKTMENFDDLANKQNAGINMSETLSDIESLKNQLYG
ncbi:DnaD domain protein [Ligilactobacillus ruminis]|uniref:DnaD domain protein n=1 Tax=Ligilactobacillus ruminis TaxID=1623 RepID=UPI00030C8BD3|nr:DnaD domain protein [Ligilactobacillus ruminis]